MRLLRPYAVTTAMLLLLLAFYAPTESQDKRIPVKIAGKRFLPLRVLARPFSHIYQAKDISQGIVEENVPAFQPFYVYTRPNPTDAVSGWYEVGSDTRGNVLGWMRGEDVLEWKQTMSLAYTHPTGRMPVLMFKDREYVLRLIQDSRDRRKKDVQALYDAIELGSIAPTFPVQSIEPKQAIDITEQFYLLPIIDFDRIELEGREGRLLKLAAATLHGRGRSSIQDQLTQPRAGSTDIEDRLKTLQIDLVFVMDMTGSMQPYIDATLNAVRHITQLVTRDAQTHKSIRFGLWGYRDSPEIPEHDFNTKNFTPELQTVEDFIQTISQVRAAPVTTDDVAEDVFSGIDHAMRKTRWNTNALRFLVLIGDAPGHEAGHRWNYSKQTERTLRLFANDNKIYIFAVLIRNPRYSPYHALATGQFRSLSNNKGLHGEASFYLFDAAVSHGFTQVASDISGALVSLVTQAKRGQFVFDLPSSTPRPWQRPSDPGELASKMGYAALVEWIGARTGAQAPRDIVAWAVDKDLLDPATSSMDVRILITKTQLDSLAKVLDAVITAGRLGQISGDDFFTALQVTIAPFVRNPDLVRPMQHARSMAAFIPEFLVGLPYRSTLMAMTNELWRSWSNDEQDEFLRDLEAKVQLYRTYHDTPTGWIQLNKQDAPDDFVYPLNLEALP